MPKVLVLFDSRDTRAERLADLAAEGAKNVRFTEVDVRVVGDDAAETGTKWKRVESGDAVDQYDGVVLVGSDQENSGAIDWLLTKLQRSANGEFVDRVFAAVYENESAGQRLSGTGGIVVGVAAGSADMETAARRTGERVAKVGEWVRHALSHQHRHG